MQTCNLCPQPKMSDTDLCYYHSKTTEGVFAETFVGKRSCKEEGCPNEAGKHANRCYHHAYVHWKRDPEQVERTRIRTQQYNREHRAESTQYVRDRRQHYRQNPIGPDHKAHGTVNGYTYYQCRCAPCAHANTEIRRRRAAQKKAEKNGS